MFTKEFGKGIRFKFLSVLSIFLFMGTVVLSTVIALNEEKTFEHSLTTKGISFASYIAKLGQDPLITKDSIHLDSLVNEANKDEDISYTVIRDSGGNLVTSQYASVNYTMPRFKAILSGLPKDSELPDIIAAIKQKEAIIELSVPIRTGADTIGLVTIGMSEYNIHKQIRETILFRYCAQHYGGGGTGGGIVHQFKKIDSGPHRRAWSGGRPDSQWRPLHPGED